MSAKEATKTTVSDLKTSPTEQIVKPAQNAKTSVEVNATKVTPARRYTATQESTVGKKAIIVFAYPDKNSYYGKMLEAAKKGLELKKKPYEVIDLYEDKFNPVYEGVDLALYSKGQTTDKDCIKYAEQIKECDELVVIYPTMFQQPSPMIKGFFDKTFLEGDYWKVLQPTFVFPFLWGTTTWIRKVSIFTTSSTSNIGNSFKFRNAARHMIKQGTCRAMRMRQTRVFNLGKFVSDGTPKTNKFLDRITKITKRELFR